MRLSPATALLALLPFTLAQRNLTSQFLRSDLQRFDDRPDGCPACPSCFNCNNEVDQCTNNAQCNQPNGKCICPAGFGGDDCSEPLCGSLADGLSRQPRKQDEQQCTCNEGWGGINCNVCETNQACDALMPKDENGDRLGGVCYKDAEVVKTNYQMCDITNAKIIKQLGTQIPQATVSCQADDSTCSFQFWIDQIESFSCALDSCKWTSDRTEEKNVTKYECEHIHCQCIPDRMLCGKDGSVDIGEYLDTLIVGPATLSTTVYKNGETQSIFSEPGMNGLISSVFADPNIQMKCRSGECLYKTEVPGYEVPIPRINTPLIAGVIAGCALFIVACGLLAWYLSRRPPRGDGYVYLVDSDDESSRITDHKAASLQFSGVSYMLNGRDLLADIQGTAPSGQVTAIMGASGAGKTTCLDILARKNKRGTVTGDFYINGETVSDTDFRNMVGFVDQEDTMLPTLTVHETIRNSALLRLPRDMNISIKEQRVHEVEKQLGIFHIKDQLIGSEEGKGRGISGGEKRRVGIACELVTSPSILFLDEPTSGLDAYNAYNVIECLVNLAKNYNRTIIFSIHQPRSNIVALFDQLILLAKGRTVYAGPFDSCQAYFDSIGYQCPPGFNIADYLVDLTMHVGNPDASTLARQIVIPDPRRDNKTAASSILAVKSVASRSLLSQSPADSLLRPPALSRKLSVKQKQDRELFTRSHSNYTDAGESTRPDDDDDLVEDGKQTPQNWHRLNSNLGPVPEQRAESFTDLPSALAGITADLQHLYNSYESSDVAASIQEEIRAAIQSASTANGHPNGSTPPQNKESSYKSYRRIGLFRQFVILSSRTWKNLYRNPMLLLSHYAISIVMAVLCGYLFYGLTNDISGFQNRLGLLFFVLALLGFSTLTSLTVFASERLLFVRERANGYYAPITYFAAKVVFDIVPLRIIPPVILGIIIYPMTGMIPAWGQFWIFILVLVLFNLAAASVCLLIGILFKNQGVANLIGSLTMLFSLLFAGLLLNHDKMPVVAQWLQKLSIFHYGYEALMVNEVGSLQLIDKKYGLDIEVPGAAILSSFGFDNSALWSDVIGLAVLSAALLVVAYTAMHFLLVERR